MRIGLTLSGGGARGISHLGVLQALEEFDVKPTIISGASAGSIVGSLYGYG
jgi:NTE family protein